MTSLDTLKASFAAGLKNEDVKNLEMVLTDFDGYCREKVAQETDVENKKVLIKQLLSIHKQWNDELLQLKAKVNNNLADIKLNAKKINKYLTSY